MTRPSVAARSVRRWSPAAGSRSDDDLVVVEEPLEVRVEHGPVGHRRRTSVAVTMRTPGHEFDLALGFLFGEGLLADPDDVEAVVSCRDADGQPSDDLVRVVLRPGAPFDPSALTRHTVATSSCGVCGRASLDQLAVHAGTEATWIGPPLAPASLADLPHHLTDAQTAFRHTGGMHAAALFDAAGCLVIAREDVGRHNAVDKVVGHCWIRRKVPLDDHLLLLSGRTSYELVQKAARAGIPVVAAVGAPSSLACDVADAHGVTLVGFLRDDRFNVYTHPGRVGS